MLFTAITSNKLFNLVSFISFFFSLSPTDASAFFFRFQIVQFICKSEKKNSANNYLTLPTAFVWLAAFFLFLFKPQIILWPFSTEWNDFGWDGKWWTHTHTRLWHCKESACQTPFKLHIPHTNIYTASLLPELIIIVSSSVQCTSGIFLLLLFLPLLLLLLLLFKAITCLEQFQMYIWQICNISSDCLCFFGGRESSLEYNTIST